MLSDDEHHERLQGRVNILILQPSGTRVHVGLCLLVDPSFTNHFTADLGRQWRLVMKASSVDTVTHPKTNNC